MKLANGIVVVVLALSAAAARADINSQLSRWNVVTAGNAALTDPVQGSVFVGGNLVSGNPIATAESSVAGTNITLAVAGNITSWANVNYGSTVVGGSSVYIAQGNGTLTTGSSIPAAISPVSALIQNSLYWSTLTPNGTLSTSSGGVTFNTTSASPLAVIDVTGAQTFNANLYNGINLSLASGVNTVLINVNAGSISEQYAPELSAFQNAFGEGHVLFNFYNATNITLSGSTFYGYVLAPNATVSLVNGVVGGIMASNISNIGGVGVDLPAGSSGAVWAGSLPTFTPAPAPEPATLALLPAGAADFWAFRRRLARR